MYQILFPGSFASNSLPYEMEECKLDILNLTVCFHTHEATVNRVI